MSWGHKVWWWTDIQSDGQTDWQLESDYRLSLLVKTQGGKTSFPVTFKEHSWGHICFGNVGFGQN